MGLHASLCYLYLHILVEIQIEDTGLSVAEHIANDVEGVALQVRGFFGQPSHPYLIGLLSDDRGVGRSRQRTLVWEYGLCHCLQLLAVRTTGRLPLSEVTLDDGHHLVGVKVASHTDGYIVGNVPVVEVVLDIGDGRILQVLLRTDSGLCAIGVGWGELLAQCTPYLVAIVGQIHVILLIDSLQLCVETTDDHVLETVGLDLGPVFDLVRGYVLGIAGDIVRCEGVGALSTDGCHQFVVLVGNEVLGCHLRHAVDFVVGLLAGCGVCQLSVGLVTGFDLVEQRSFSLIIVCAKLFAALEHQVLQVVCQACCFGWVVLRTCAYSDVGLDTGFLRVDGEIHLQTIIQRIDTCFSQVSFYCQILVILGLCVHPERHQA